MPLTLKKNILTKEGIQYSAHRLHLKNKLVYRLCVAF